MSDIAKFMGGAIEEREGVEWALADVRREEEARRKMPHPTPEKPRRGCRPLTEIDNSIERYMPAIMGIAAQYAGPDEERRRVAQDAAIDAATWAAANHQKHGSAFGTLLRRAAHVRVRCALLDYQKRKLPPRALSIPDEERGVVNKRSPDDMGFRMDVAALPDFLRVPVELVAFHGYSMAAAGGLMGLDYRTIRNRIVEAYRVIDPDFVLPM